MNATTVRSFQGLLVLIAVLLAANLGVVLSRGSQASGQGIVPQIQAGSVLKLDGPTVVTTDEQGDTLYIWQLGAYVGDGYETVKARAYEASGTKY